MGEASPPLFSSVTAGRPLSWTTLTAACPGPGRAASPGAAATAKYTAAPAGAGSGGLPRGIAGIVVAAVAAMPDAIGPPPLAVTAWQVPVTGAWTSAGLPHRAGGHCLDGDAGAHQQRTAEQLRWC